jgi:hypothetical protein
MNLTFIQKSILSVMTLACIAMTIHLTTSIAIAHKSTALQGAPTASQVAYAMDCHDFKDLFVPGGYPGVLDEGSCYMGKQKFAIDTFDSSRVRDAWLVPAENLGVVPVYEDTYYVAYKSVPNS